MDKRLSDAVNRVPWLVESLLSSDDIYHIPIHAVPAMFAAMAMLALDSQAEETTLQSRLAQTKLSFCMLALGELRTVWPVAGWITVLFSKFSKFRNEEPSRERPASIETRDVPVAADVDTEPGEFDFGAFFSSPLHFPSDWELPSVFSEAAYGVHDGVGYSEAGDMVDCFNSGY